MARRKAIDVPVSAEDQKAIELDIEKDLMQANAIIAKTLLRRGEKIEEVAITTGLSVNHVTLIKNSMRKVRS